MDIISPLQGHQFSAFREHIKEEEGVGKKSYIFYTILENEQ